MLKFGALQYLTLGDAMRLIQMAMGDDNYPAEISENGDKELRDDLNQVAGMCAELGLPVTEHLARELLKALPRTAREFALLSGALQKEMELKFLLYIPPERASYYDNESTLTDQARAAFPTAYRELREASTCYALERYTAAAIHSMRAAEVGVKALCKHLGHTPPDLEQSDWHPLLLKCEALITEQHKLPKGPEKEQELQLLSRAAKQFRYFKDGDRIQAAHTRKPYWQNEAKEIVDATVSFFETLATRLSE